MKNFPVKEELIKFLKEEANSFTMISDIEIAKKFKVKLRYVSYVRSQLRQTTTLPTKRRYKNNINQRLGTEKIKQMINEGKNYHDIAKEFNVSYSVAVNICWKKNLKIQEDSKYKNAKQIKKIVSELYESGLSDLEISQQIGKSKHAVSQIRYRMNKEN